MFAVKIDTKKKDRPKVENGCLWVKSAEHPYYVTRLERGIFKTREEAARAKTEDWEVIVDV